MVSPALIVLATLATQKAADEPVGIGPAPSPVPISWEFDFQFLDLRRIEVELPDAGVQTFWYVVYTVTNTSPRTQRFFPRFQIFTEDLETIDSDIGISPLVFDAIRERHRQTHPELLHPSRAIGDLSAGADHARESVAIWRQFDLRVNRLSVFVAGLSGEKRFIRRPVPRAEREPAEAADTGLQSAPAEAAGSSAGGANTDGPRHFTLRKTLEIQYLIPGSPATREGLDPQRLAIRWVMR